MHRSTFAPIRRLRLAYVVLFLSGTLVQGIAFSDDAQSADSDKSNRKQEKHLTLERIYDSSEFSASSYSGRWDDEQDKFWVWQTKDAGRCLYLVDPLSDDEELVISADDITPPGESSPLRVESYEWSPNRDKLLLFTNSERVWRYRTRGDYWVLDRSSRELRKLGGSDGAPSSLMFAKFSPDGNNVAYVRDQQVYEESLLDNSIRAVTQAHSEKIINGTFDWVYEEELSARDGFRYSKDGGSLAYWSLDTTGVRTFTMINNTDAFYPRVIEFPYPKTGQTNSACSIFVRNRGQAKHRRLSIPGDPRQHYLARMEFHGDQHVIVQQLNRLQNENRVYRVNVLTNQFERLVVEKDDAWVDIHDEMKWFKDGRRFTWMSERNGWRQLFVYSLDSQQLHQVTGDYDVIELVALDEGNNAAYFMASPDNATQSYLYRIKLDGSELERITPEKQSGTHRYQISPTGKYAVHHWSSFGVPPRVELIELPSHKRLKKLETNEKLRKKLKRLAKVKREFLRIEIDPETTLDAWCLLPPKFDSQKKYPLLVYVYGEPAGQTVLDRWQGSGYLWHLMMAQKGYVVASIDNRGTPAPRGRDWRKCVYRRVGDLAPADQAAAVRKLLSDRPYLDASRVGVWGWSGGGSMTLNALFKYPDLYKTGISIAPVPNQRHYDTIYQERYMGLPSDNVEGYIKGSPIHFAKQLEGSLLVVHGTGDDNCHYQTTEALINELIRHGKQFSMMAYPNRSHSIREGKGTTMHLRTMMVRFLEKHLPVDGSPQTDVKVEEN